MADSNSPAGPPTLLTLDEAATFLRTPVGTLRYWRHRGVGPAGFRLGRRVMYRREDLNRWVSERQESDADRRSVWS
jgi:excisionase family DNA binding protein